MTQDPEAILQAWMNSVNQGETDRLCALYAEGSTLLPTFSPHLLATPEKLRGYFEQLASRPNLRVSLHQKTLRKQQLDAVHFVLTGIYTWEFEIDETPLTFASRFTYVLDVSSEQPIIHHHSSQVPRTLN